MARSESKPSLIYGIQDSCRYFTPYHDLKDVLNTIGVMAKRSEIPYARVIIPPSKKKIYCFRHFNGCTYVVPKNWRSCLYEDLETGDYYIVSPDPENAKYNPEYVYSWIAFKVTGLTDGMCHYGRDDSGKRTKEIFYHSGSFIDLIKRCNLNEILDTLAKNQKPIAIKIIHTFYNTCSFTNSLGVERSACQFDI